MQRSESKAENLCIQLAQENWIQLAQTFVAKQARPIETDAHEQKAIPQLSPYPSIYMLIVCRSVPMRARVLYIGTYIYIHICIRVYIYIPYTYVEK